MYQSEQDIDLRIDSSNVEHDHSRKQPIGTSPISTTAHTVSPRTTTTKHVLGRDASANNSHTRSTRPHGDSLQTSDKIAPLSISKNKKPQGQDGGGARTAPSGKALGHQDMSVKSPRGLETTKDYNSTDRSQDWKEKQQSMLEGVVDLNDTVDTDRDTTWAPGEQPPLNLGVKSWYGPYS